MHAYCSLFFFFNDTATTEIYTLSLHDALPISPRCGDSGITSWKCPSRITRAAWRKERRFAGRTANHLSFRQARSEEHTSELQSRQYLVCRLLLEKKKKNTNQKTIKNTTINDAK